MRNRFRLIFVGSLVFATTSAFGQAAPAAQTDSMSKSQPAPVVQTAQVATNQPVAMAQAASNSAFDVASVRPSEMPDQAKMMAAMQAGKMPRFGARIDGLRAEYSQMSLKDLVANAYGVKPYQVSGPDFINGQRFDIAAKMPEGSTKDDAPKMLRALLEDRFKLQALTKVEDHPVYALIVGKGGPKLKESAEKAVAIDANAELKPGETKMDGPMGLMIIKRNPDGSSTANLGEQGRFVQRFNPQAGSLHLEGSSVTMKGFAEMLTQFAMMGGNSVSGRQVVDMTELKGFYDVTLDLSLAEMMRNGGGPGGGQGGAAAVAADPGGGGLGLLDSVQKMGLKLDPRKAPVQQVVVTHSEKMPTDN
jgi:uncharacterized protein (TIGR03435 family)